MQKLPLKTKVRGYSWIAHLKKKKKQQPKATLKQLLRKIHKSVPEIREVSGPGFCYKLNISYLLQ